MTRLRRAPVPGPPSPAVAPAVADLGAPLPASTDVAVIGGGLAGCALAYYLARRAWTSWCSSAAS